MNNIYVRKKNQTLFDESCRKSFTPHTNDILNQTLDKTNSAYEKLYADAIRNDISTNYALYFPAQKCSVHHPNAGTQHSDRMKSLPYQSDPKAP